MRLAPVVGPVMKRWILSFLPMSIAFTLEGVIAVSAAVIIGGIVAAALCTLAIDERQFSLSRSRDRKGAQPS
jgi:hypothetical protein